MLSYHAFGLVNPIFTNMNYQYFSQSSWHCHCRLLTLKPGIQLTSADAPALRGVISSLTLTAISCLHSFGKKLYGDEPSYPLWFGAFISH